MKNPEDRSMQAVLSYTEDLARLSYAPGETLITAPGLALKTLWP